MLLILMERALLAGICAFSVKHAVVIMAEERRNTHNVLR